jgi:PAP2 superfamily
VLSRTPLGGFSKLIRARRSTKMTTQSRTVKLNRMESLMMNALNPVSTRAVVLKKVLAIVCFASAFSNAQTTESLNPTLAPEVFDWNAFASELVSDQLPPIQTQVLAVAHIAIHDAINAIESRYEPYEYRGTVPQASLPAAVAAAAHAALVRVLPAIAARIDARYIAKLASIPDGTGKDAGIFVGQSAAAAILARRGGEDLFGAFAKRYTTGPAMPEVYQPTPPLNKVFLAGWGELVPFAMESNSQFRSGAPFLASSPQYAKDYNEVKDFGAAKSATRSGQQSETARFWFDVATKEWHSAARQGLTDVHADEWQAARTLALVSIAMADGVIASAETKFHFNYWRPITAIHAGDHDGNSATRGDSTWEPLCNTPPFPEHNSTHAVTGAAAAEALARTIGDRHTFTIDSPTLAGVRRTYGRFSTAAEEEGLSRIFCGIHFRNGMLAGLEQGKRVAHFAVTKLLRPMHRRSDDDRPPIERR